MEDKKELRTEINTKTGFILAIIGLATFFIMGLGVIPSTAGLILSILANKQNKNDRTVINIELSIIGIIINLMVLIAVIVNMIIYRNYK